MIINAKAFIDASGDRAIGQRVFTAQMGDYPGGEAIITEINPDPNAPEIVMMVKHPTYGDVGIFDTEIIGIILEETK